MAARRNYQWNGSRLFDGEPNAPMNPYPCQTCHKPFRARRDLATHHCDPYGRKPEPKSEHPRTNQFTDDQVRDIRKRYAEKEAQASIARAYGVGTGVINRIVHRQRYADVPDEPTT